MINHALIRGLLLAGVSAAALATGASTVRAQSVNYGALEELYGEPVTTSVTGKPQKASEAPANITIISSDDIRRSGANNIPDILRYVTGIDIRRYGAMDAEVAIRGYNQPQNPRLLVLVNGRQVYFDDYGYVSWQSIPVQLEEIRQIEVVKGPNSALFGFNAASGVINIITYDPLFDNVNAATLRFGSQALLQGSAVATIHAGDNAGLRMSFGGLQQQEYQQIGIDPLIASLKRSPQSGVFNLDGKARVAPGVEVTLEGSMGTAQYNEQGAMAFAAFSTYHTNSIKAGLMADTSWGTIAVDAYRNWLGAGHYTGATVSFDNTVYVVQASDTMKLNADHTLRVGLEYRNNTLRSAVVAGAVGYAVYSTSGMWDWQITPTLSFTNSVRLDYLTLNYSGTLASGTGFTNSQYNNATITQPSFNSGLVWKVTDLDTLRLTGARGLQVPSLIDFGLQALPAIGSPTLQPTAVWNMELGYDRSVPQIGSVVRSSVFVQRNDRLLTSGTSTAAISLPSGTAATIAANTGYSDAIGGEIGIKGHSESGFRWNASYAFMAISDHTTLNKPVVTSPQNYEEGTPTSVVIVGGGYTWDKLEIDGQMRWQSRFKDYRFSSTAGLQPLNISDYITFQARIAYNLTEHLTLALTGQQFQMSRLLQSAGPPVERSVIASLTAHY